MKNIYRPVERVKRFDRLCSTTVSSIEWENKKISRTNDASQTWKPINNFLFQEPPESMETNLSFVRRKCDEWLNNGIPKVDNLRIQIDESDLNIDKEWQPFLNDDARAVRLSFSKEKRFLVAQIRWLLCLTFGWENLSTTTDNLAFCLSLFWYLFAKEIDRKSSSIPF